MSHRDKHRNRGADEEKTIMIAPPSSVYDMRCPMGCRIVMHKCSYLDSVIYVGQCRHTIYHTSGGRHISHDKVRAYAGMLPG